MAQEVIIDESIYQDSTTKSLCNYYLMLLNDNNPTEMLTTLLLSDVFKNSYYWAHNEAASKSDTRGRNRFTYSDEKARLIDYSPDPNVNQEVEEQSLELLSTAINNYIASKGTPDMSTSRGDSDYKLVCSLITQVLTKGYLTLFHRIVIPDYLKEQVGNIIELLESKVDSIFVEWLQDLEDTGNSHLIDYTTQQGPKVFGTASDTKSNVYFDNYIKPFKASINNYSEVYNRYKDRRSEFRIYAGAPEQKIILPFFNMTADMYNKKQRALYQDFELYYGQDTNTQYLYKLIYGVE